MHIVTECLRPIPTDYLQILAGIQPAEFRRQGTTLSLAYRSLVDPKHLLYQLMIGPTTAHEKRLRFYILLYLRHANCSMNYLN